MFEDLNLYDRIYDRLNQRANVYSKFNKARDTIVSYFRPDLGVDAGKDGDFFGQDIYEGTPPWAARIFATGFQGTTISANIDWISYLMKQYELRGVDKIDIWCQDIREYMTSVYRDSNVYGVWPQFTLDAVTIGSPVMFIEEESPVSGVIKFMPEYYKNVTLFYNKYNEPTGIIVKDTSWTAQQIYDEFISKAEKDPSKRAELKKKLLSTSLNSILDSGQGNQESTVIRAVFRADDAIFDKLPKPLGGQEWISIYFEENTDKNKDKPLRMQSYFTRPFIVWDYDKKPYEALSRTPAYDAIYDCLSLQQVHKNFLENVQLKNRPPRIVLAEMMNRIKFTPEGLTAVSEEEYDRPPKALDLIGDLQYNEKLSMSLAEACKRHFHVDQFYIFSQIAMGKKQPLTATQIWQMAGEKSTLLSPAIESHSKCMSDMDSRCIDIEYRAGRGAFAPDIMENIKDVIMSNLKRPVKSIGIMPQFMGLLNRAQRSQQSLDPILSTFEAAAPLFQLDPNLRFAIKGYETLESIVKATGFEMKNLKSKEDYEGAVNQMNEQIQADAKTQEMIEMAKAAKGISGKVEPDSVLGSMVGAA
ncbi:MAG: portal protein [Candidatus Omnitrophota bacterium]